MPCISAERKRLFQLVVLSDRREVNLLVRIFPLQTENLGEEKKRAHKCKSYQRKAAWLGGKNIV